MRYFNETKLGWLIVILGVCVGLYMAIHSFYSDFADYDLTSKIAWTLFTFVGGTIAGAVLIGIWLGFLCAPRRRD